MMIMIYYDDVLFVAHAGCTTKLKAEAKLDGGEAEKERYGEMMMLMR